MDHFGLILTQLQRLIFWFPTKSAREVWPFKVNLVEICARFMKLLSLFISPPKAVICFNSFLYLLGRLEFNYHCHLDLLYYTTLYSKNFTAFFYPHHILRLITPPFPSKIRVLLQLVYSILLISSNHNRSYFSNFCCLRLPKPSLNFDIFWFLINLKYEV